jgi:RNA polymerase sigma-70 factor (family 1)
MHLTPDYAEQLLLLRAGDEQAFEFFYEHFADRLYTFTYNRIRSKEEAEEIIQEIFISLWTNRQKLNITRSIESYLFSAANYRLLNSMQAANVRKKYAADFSKFLCKLYDSSTEEAVNLRDLESLIEERISELPKQCQTAFRLSRMQDESIQAIAQRMNISTRTVENYITKALKHLRANLGELIVIILCPFLP